MTAIAVVRDVYDSYGRMLVSTPMMIDDSRLAEYQLYGWRLPFGAPTAPARNQDYPQTTHSPTDIWPWVFDWSDFLDAGETLTSSLWLCSGLTLSGEALASPKTSLMATGGTDGQQILVTNRVTTSTGRQDDQSFVANIIQR